MFLALLLAARTVMGGLDFCASFYEDFDDLWDDDAWWYYLDDAWWYYLDDASWYYVDDAWWYYFRNNTSHNETALWYYYLDDGSNVTNSYGFDEGYDYGYNDLGDYVGYDDFGYDEHFYDNYGYYKGRRRLEESYDSWMCGYYDDGGSSTCDGTVGDEDDCASGTSSVLLKIADAYGDGWDGACWSISPGGYGGGISCMDCEEPCCTMNYTLCLDSDVEYEFSVGGEDQRGSYDDEIVWQLGSWTGTGAADASFTVDMLEYPSTVAPTAFVSTIVTSVVMNLSSSDIVFFTHTFDASASSSSEVAEITNVEALLQPGASNVSFDFTFYLFNNDTLIERETATGGLLVLHAKELTKRELRTAVQPYVMGSATTTFDKGVGFLSGSGLSFNGEPGDRGALFNVRICLPSELSFPESNADDELSLTLALDFAYCIPGQHETSESCDACDSGKYSFETSEECKDCPSHAQCPHKGHQGHNAGYSVNVRKGYWRDSATSTNVRLCVYQSYCDSPRATLVETKRDSDNSNLSVVFSDGSGGGTSSADEQCTHHHKGPLCALCEHGFGIQSTTGECVKCSTTSWKIAVALGGLLFLFFAGALCRLQLWSVESAETLRDGIEEAEEKVQDAAQEVSGSLKRMRAIIKHIGTLQKHLAPLVTVGFKARLKIYYARTGVCISIIGNYRFAFPSIYYPRVPNISFAFLNSLSFNLGNLASSVCLVTTNYYGHLLLMT
ncbi:hypothetical protein CTAYLR_004685 [Chrysophaeum taylorii]|uniref:Tyrosine-protein kinase ephrin type A/B receptor-like domain-containing protein n=1 Tax=Chrysophaeum taylorii TaxID=2483200 RepID=A0AAD7U7A0_9STRA|nr:hypothetical protein CTAYLR_004685 [Chrysophaeum taylorii]